MNKESEYDTELAIGVAAAAYAINSLQKDEAQRRIKTEMSSLGTITRKRSSDRVTRRYSSKEIETAGETSSRQESTMPTSKPGSSSSARPINMEVVEAKADAWEKAEMEKVNKRSEKMKASILAWENERKLRAKVNMDRRKTELEHKIRRAQQLYQAKIVRIDLVAGLARSQADEKGRNEELKFKEKAREIRASGKVPVRCFCF